MVDRGTAVGVGAVALVDAGRAVGYRGSVISGLVNGGSVIVTVQLVNGSHVYVRATVRISPLIDGGVVMVAVLLVNSGLIEIGRTPGIIALDDGGGVVATVLLADGVGVVVIGPIATT